MKKTALMMTNELKEMLDTYRRYLAEFMYFEAQYNFPTSEEMREHAAACKPDQGIVEREAKKALDVFNAKYQESEEYEDEYYRIDFASVLKEVKEEACTIAKAMRIANNVGID